MWWFRGVIVRRAVEQAVVLFVAIGIATTVLMLLAVGLAPLPSVSVGVVVGQAGVLLVAGVAATINPVSWRYLRDLRAGSPRYEGWIASDDAWSAALAPYVEDDFDYVMSAIDSANVDESAADVDEHIIDVAARPDRSVFVAVSRASGAAMAMSLLSDGRALVTTTVGMPPHTSLIVNLVENDGSIDLVAAHHEAVEVLSDAGFEVRPGGSGLFPWVMMVEWRAYCQLGSSAWLIDPVGGTGPFRFEVPARKTLLLGIESPPEVLSGRQAPLVDAR